MRNYILSLIGLALLGSAAPVFAEYFQYRYSIDEHTYDLEYQFGGNVLAMQVDQELRSFLIGIEGAKDELFVILLPNELISAASQDFVILVDGFGVQYDIESSDNFNVFSIPVFAGSQEIEIIGANVIPEFPIGVLLILMITISSIIVLSRNLVLFR